MINKNDVRGFRLSHVICLLTAALTLGVAPQRCPYPQCIAKVSKFIKKRTFEVLIFRFGP